MRSYSCPPLQPPARPRTTAAQIARDKLVSLGTCVGKFTHSGKFRLTIGCLDLLAQYAKYKVCVVWAGWFVLAATALAADATNLLQSSDRIPHVDTHFIQHLT
jgi:hypothetical protein